MADTKNCPACAEEVKAEAKICKHCGYNFETGTPGGTYVGPVPPRTSKAGKWIGIIAVIFLLLLAVGMFAPDPATGPVGSDNDSTAEPPLKVTAAELFAAYDANEAAAQQQYGDRRLEVAAVVNGVDLDISDKPVVLLRTQNEFMSAHANLTEASQAKASSLSKGQQIVLVCESVSEIIGTPMLKDCEIQ